MACWSDLPTELLDIIAARFDAPSDTRHFRSVCVTWRSAVPRPFPVQFPPIKFLSSKLHHCDLRLAKHTFYHLSSSSNPDSPGWLIKAEEHKLGSFQLFNPFSRTSIENLPINFPKHLDLTNFRIRELGYEYVLRNIGDTMDMHNMEHEKVALINSNVDDYFILSTHNTGKLLLYRSDQQEWSFLDGSNLGYDNRSIFVNDWSLQYVDVVAFNGMFYAVTNSGRTISIKVEVGSTASVTLVKKSIIGGDKKCLVKSGSDLLMVDLYTDTTPELVKVHAVEIFKLQEEEQKWILAKSLGNHSIFLSNHSSFSAVGLPGCKGNCIYFRFKNLEKNSCCSDVKQGNREDFTWKSKEIGVFDFDNGFVVGSLEEYLEDSMLFTWPLPGWVTLASNFVEDSPLFTWFPRTRVSC